MNLHVALKDYLGVGRGMWVAAELYIEVCPRNQLPDTCFLNSNSSFCHKHQFASLRTWDNSITSLGTLQSS